MTDNIRLDELIKLGLVKPHKTEFVLTRQGQIIYGGSDPYFWKQRKTKHLSKAEAISALEKMFKSKAITEIE